MVLLLTSSHISVLISSGIIFLFTLILFLSGYALQQQTVHNLQRTLHPSATPTVQVLQVYPTGYTVDGVRMNGTGVEGEREGKGKVAKAFGSPPGSNGYQDVIGLGGSGSGAAGAGPGPEPGAQTGEGKGETEAALHPLTPTDTAAEKLEELDRWKGLAYVQLLTSPEDICSSLLFYGTLSKQGSSVPGRVVMYPSSWSSALTSSSSASFANPSSNSSEGKISSGKATALHALKKAKDGLGLTLQPVDIPADSTAAATLIESAFLLPGLKRILYVRGHGMLLNTTALDEILYASKAVEMAVGIAATGSEEEVKTRSLFLMRPGEKVWGRLSGEIDKMSDESLDGVWLGLETMRGLNMPRLQMADSHGVRTLGERKGEKAVGGKEEDSAYMHFEKEEVEDGVVRVQRGGLWWDGLVRYRKGVGEVCQGLDLRDEMEKQVVRTDAERVVRVGDRS
jgi:hypothetical protein